MRKPIAVTAKATTRALIALLLVMSCAPGMAQTSSAAPSAGQTGAAQGAGPDQTPPAQAGATDQTAPAPITIGPVQAPQDAQTPSTANQPLGPSAPVPQIPITPEATAPNSASAGAPPPGAPVFNLAQTIQMALAASAQLQIANRNLDRDRALVDQAEAGYRPRLEATGTEVYLDEPVKIKFGSESILVQPVSTQTLTGALNLPVDITGQVRAQIEAARLTVLADTFGRNRIANQRILDAETAYFTLLRSQHQVDVAQASLTDAQTQYATTERQFAGGIGQRIDVYRAATQVAQAQQDLLAAQNQLAIARNDFNDIIGRPMAASAAVPDVPGVDVGVNITGGAITPGANPNSLVTPPAGLPSLYTPPTATNMAIDQSVQSAMANRPELQADQVEIEAAHRQIKIAHAGQEPTLSLGADSNYYPTTDFQNPYHSLDVFTATVNIPLYDGGVTRDRVREAKDSEENAKTQLSGDRTDVELQVRQAYLNLSTAEQQIDSANTALQQAIIARQLAQVRYANGVGLYLEVTDAQSALTSAEQDQVNAVYNYFISRAQYQNAIGTPSLNPTL
jgi:outer membrane protein TolC